MHLPQVSFGVNFIVRWIFFARLCPNRVSVEIAAAYIFSIRTAERGGTIKLGLPDSGVCLPSHVMSV